MKVASAAELQIMYDAAQRRQRELHGAAPTTIEALMYSLRRGTGALAHPDAQRRLSELNDRQLLEVAARVQKFKPEIAQAWTPEDVEMLVAVRSELL